MVKETLNCKVKTYKMFLFFILKIKNGQVSLLIEVNQQVFEPLETL